MQKNLRGMSNFLQNMGYGRFKIFYIYNLDMIFQKKMSDRPFGTRFCISERKKFVYVQTTLIFGSRVLFGLLFIAHPTQILYNK